MPADPVPTDAQADLGEWPRQASAVASELSGETGSNMTVGMVCA